MQSLTSGNKPCVKVGECFQYSWYRATLKIMFHQKCAHFKIRGLFIKACSSEAKGKHPKGHGVPGNKLEAFSDLNRC